jgi:hypothetical protein
MPDARLERSDLNYFNQFVQEVIGGAVRRYTFTQWELELLLDLQMARIRKSARPEVLRRYLKAVQQHFAEGNTKPLRLSVFLERELEARAAAAAALEAQTPTQMAAH